VPVTTRVLKGNPAEALLAYVDRVKAGLVICGLSAAKGFGFFVGTHVDLIIRHSKVPVLVTGPWPPGPFMRLLVPTDLDRPDEAAFRLAAGLVAAQGKGKVRALHVHERPTVLHGYLGNVAALRKGIREQARKLFDRYVRKLELPAGSRNVALLLKPGSDAVHAAGVIVAEAERCKADLIVMALGRRKLLQALHIGGTAEKVLRRLPCSILALPVDWARKR
jgi:nucleotide-binding universal stress UspA family protein